VTASDQHLLDDAHLRRLHRYLGDVGVPLQGELSTELVSGGKSNLTLRLTDGTSRWMLRRPPLGEYFAGAHDVSREFRVMGALAHTNIPVPTMVCYCSDVDVIGAPFYVMAEVPGTVLRRRSEVAALPVDTRRRLSHTMVDTLADLHQVNVQRTGLQDLGRPEGYLARQVARWIRQYEQVQVREIPGIRECGRWLHDTVPNSLESSLVHGDFRVDNVITHPDDHGRIAAVLDWEMATLGDPLLDLGTFLIFWDEPGRPFNPITAGLTALPGFLSREQVIARYSQRRGIQVTGIQWYVDFSAFKLAVILEQIHARHLHGQTRGAGFETVGSMVSELIARICAGKVGALNEGEGR
jgi:aminoglycoside phosphotransferase (APT) family kinase protein